MKKSCVAVAVLLFVYILSACNLSLNQPNPTDLSQEEASRNYTDINMISEVKVDEILGKKLNFTADLSGNSSYDEIANILTENNIETIPPQFPEEKDSIVISTKEANLWGFNFDEEEKLEKIIIWDNAITSFIIIMLLTSCSLIEKPQQSDTTSTLPIKKEAIEINNIYVNGSLLNIQSIVDDKLNLNETKERLRESNIEFFENTAYSVADGIWIPNELDGSPIVFLTFDNIGLKEIEINDSRVKTFKGISTGSTIADVIQAYGDDYTEKVNDTDTSGIIIQYEHIEFITFQSEINNDTKVLAINYFIR